MISIAIAIVVFATLNHGQAALGKITFEEALSRTIYQIAAVVITAAISILLQE